MNMKKLSIVLTISLICLFLITSSSWAGETQRHRWEGVAIGIGAAMVGSALLNQYYAQHAPAPIPVPVPVPVPVYHKPEPPRPRGHWEYRKVWVPPTYEKVWNPGHYNKKGMWVPGRWIQVQTEPGHWTKEKIWVTSREQRHHH